jgi:hypothetical protein
MDLLAILTMDHGLVSYKFRKQRNKIENMHFILLY